MFEDMTWWNEPPSWSVDGNALRAVTADHTDFWRSTFYGWITDNGHFFHRPVTGDFTAEVLVSAGHTTLFDQAGMMVRASERQWLKSGIEVTGGSVHVSTVVTRDFSDVSMATLPDGPVAMRISRFGEALAVHCRAGDDGWQLVRLCYLEMPEAVDVGVMCCSPSRAGLEATFRDFRVGPPMPREGLE
jgi:regulation of enolase protein 1 (concanavalin A-like superfamily)